MCLDDGPGLGFECSGMSGRAGCGKCDDSSVARCSDPLGSPESGVPERPAHVRVVGVGWRRDRGDEEQETTGVWSSGVCENDVRRPPDRD